MATLATFRPLCWYIDEAPLDQDIIVIYGRDTENRTIAVRVVGCESYCFVRLPSKPMDIERTADNLLSDFKDVISRSNRYGRYQDPLRLEPYEGRFIRSCKPGFFYKIVMPSQGSKSVFNTNYKSCPFTGSRKLKKSGYSCSHLSFHEAKKQISTLFQLTTERNITLSGWIDVKEPTDWDPRFNRYFCREKEHSNADICITCFPDDLSPSDRDSTLNIDPTVLSFDIEAYSHRREASMPDPLSIRDRITSISFRMGHYMTDANSWKGITLSLGDSPSINSSYEVLSFMRESDLILEFGRLIRLYSPDIITGYNTVGFDWEYIYDRCRILGIVDEFFTFGRYRYQRRKNNCYVKEIQWQSSAYGNQKNMLVDAIGILQLDVYKEITVTLAVKLPVYTLNAVSEHFLKQRKRDMPIPELFRILGWKEEYLRQRDEMSFQDLKSHLLKMYKQYEIVGCLIDLRQRIELSSNSRMLYAAMLHGITLANDYCDTDALLPGLLMQKCSILENVQELSRARCVPMDYHSFRGQGIKSLALMYPRLREEMYVLNAKEENLAEDDEGYEGATVLSATEGYHEEVAILDFSSLYPSVMIDKNICITTLNAKSRIYSVLKDGPFKETVADEYIRIPIRETHIGCGCEGAKNLESAKEHPKCEIVYHEFVVESTRRGLFPRVLMDLLSARKVVKKEMFQTEQTLLEVVDPERIQYLNSRINILNLRQLAIKIACNSLYGIMGAKTSPFHEKAVAESVTAGGRDYLERACQYIYDGYPGIDVVYGDTDSTLIKFNSPEYLAQPRTNLVKVAKEIAAGISEEFGGIMTLNFENYFSSFMQITKKNYIADIWESFSDSDLDYIRTFALNHVRATRTTKYTRDLKQLPVFNRLRSLLSDYLTWQEITESVTYNPEERGTNAASKLEEYLWGRRVNKLPELVGGALDHYRNGYISYRMWKGVMAKKRGFCTIARNLYRNVVDFRMAGTRGAKMESIISDLFSMAIRDVYTPGKLTLEDYLISCNLKDPDSYDSTNSLGYLLGMRMNLENRGMRTPSRIKILYVNRDFDSASGEEKAIFRGSTDIYKGFYAEEETFYRYNSERLGLKPNKEMYVKLLTCGAIGNLVKIACGGKKVRIYDARKDVESIRCDIRKLYPEDTDTMMIVLDSLMPIGFDKTPSQRKQGNICSLEKGTSRLCDVKRRVGNVILNSGKHEADEKDVQDDKWFNTPSHSLFQEKERTIRSDCRIMMTLDDETIVDEICSVSNATRTRYVLDSIGIKSSRAELDTINGRLYRNGNIRMVITTREAAIHKQRLIGSLKDIGSSASEISYIINGASS